ncbi:DUF6089 family protein [uncultured Bacteroides sp.]|uniref:type IX secretion system protein PorG n=1 Tax=uncultured Bacteroides sp. TaxID=162156 RepID=UPI002AABC8B8|nr:DUF6089 family protein [uncultured Bacteroides sp.]
MTFINKTLIIFVLLTLSSPLFIHAQENEYRMEAGGMLGGSFYMGDANASTPFKNLQFAGGAMARYIINPHMALKANLTMGKISGNTEYFDNKYPENKQVSFSRNIFDLGSQFEYNFWGYGIGQEYKGYRKFTPYILGGIGLTFAPAPAKGIFTVNFPVGIGIKYKIAQRLNIGCEMTMRFSLSDNLDVTNKNGLILSDPYGIKGIGIKNKDSYSFTTVFITYDLFPKCRTCNNL